MLGALATWWPVLALLYVPRLAHLLAVVLARRSHSALDRAIPDDLPVTAGEWLADRLARLGHPATAVVTEHHVDGYLPQDKLILLSDQTYFKADPVYWSGAAHELGHARIHAELPAIAVLRAGAGWLGSVLVMAGTGLALGRVLYALPIAGALAVHCFAVASGLTIFTLLDEALASVLAYRELRASDAITAGHRRAIRWALTTAFATYLVTYVSYALLLRYWPLLDARAAIAVQASRLTPLGWALAVVASLGCVVAIVHRLTWMFAPRSLAGALASRRGWSLGLALAGLSTAVLLWLAWDHRADATYAWCAIIALAASANLWMSIVWRLLTLPHYLVGWILAALVGPAPGVDRTPRYLRALEQGADLVAAGNRRVQELARRHVGPRWPKRILALTALGYLPLLVALWLW